MKKVALTVILVFCMLMLAGCVMTVDEQGIERPVEYGLIEVCNISGNGDSAICYDPTTKVCYLKQRGRYRLSVCPYYVIGEDGKPEIAVYGVNYGGRSSSQEEQAP